MTFDEKVVVKKSHETDPLKSKNITAELKKMCYTQEAHSFLWFIRMIKLDVLQVDVYVFICLVIQTWS